MQDWHALPAPLLEQVAGNVSVPDQPHFRLACLSWRDALPCSEFRHRITVSYKQDWEASALELRRKMPNIALAVKVNGLRNVLELLEHPLCITVRCFPQQKKGTEEPSSWLPLGEWSTHKGSIELASSRSPAANIY